MHCLPLIALGFVRLQAAELAAAVAADNSRAEAIFFSGATGARSQYINGIFDPTGEKGLDGRIFYKKRSAVNAAAIWIAHVAGKWLIQPDASKGSTSSIAFFAGGCVLEACKEKVLSVYDGKAFKEEPDIKMATGAEAEAQARGSSSI
jgi:hypothetical protein